MKHIKANIQEFLHHESMGGALLIAATILALVCNNTFLSEFYTEFLKTRVSVTIDEFSIDKPLILWINDGLMAMFFFLIGLELKRELLEGELKSLSQLTLPAIAGLGGIIAPALIFYAFTKNDSFAVQGWAIPTATDTAFAIGILSMLGTRIPPSLKIFLVALAIIDDVCAILIMALFYTKELSLFSFGIGGICVAVLFVLNLLNVKNKAVYLFVGIIFWTAVLKSGVHATLAGIITAFFIPLKFKDDKRSMLKNIEHDLHGVVAFIVLPIFAFANAGISLSDVSMAHLFSAVPLGTMLGLFIGKQLGIFGFSFLAIKLGFAKIPKGINFVQLYGLSALCGIGFTMSLFINGLSYGDSDMFAYTDRLAILLGSVCSGILGFLVLRFAPQRCDI
ncbi:pH-dependent sodium/proton antiporter [Campylobacter mucosalis]|uniref:Na+/H+ antiporter NhaA n=1 Tax=Campylobacter mucosalis TaxID=202 RepID=UPI0004DA0D97|nr:Na+/H+ antiporter NhaA [Campylobacter mucosalis]KEA45246.1 pH-dependent sodium/proton antiporter [Campylobacter mucosalis]QKF63746.1 sodium:proton antiporter [Campylobacter mucosalis]